MNSGKSPDQVLNELLASGQFTQDQVNQAIGASKQNSGNTKGSRF